MNSSVKNFVKIFSDFSEQISENQSLSKLELTNKFEKIAQKVKLEEEKYDSFLKFRILNKIEKLKEYNQNAVAIQCLTGFMQRFFYIKEVRFFLAELYFESNNPVNAGRFWYFLENPNEKQVECLMLFEKSCGNNSEVILHSLCFNFNQSFRDNFYKLEQQEQKKMIEMSKQTKLSRYHFFNHQFEVRTDK